VGDRCRGYKAGESEQYGDGGAQHGSILVNRVVRFLFFGFVPYMFPRVKRLCGSGGLIIRLRGDSGLDFGQPRR
jgi:hypothetical protein